jgi:hypothetical protein
MPALLPLRMPSERLRGAWHVGDEFSTRRPSNLVSPW